MKVDPHVQALVANTNGNLYLPLVNRLSRYPIPRWPGETIAVRGSLLLDIGCGWGRWMVSGAQVGYVPVGVDVQMEHLAAARRVLRDNGVTGYVVAADLRCLPFAPNAFDKVFSYSVLQHAHRRACESCLHEVLRVVKPGGNCSIEFPISHGLTNWRHRRDRAEEDDPESWSVRYYARSELKRLFSRIFGNADIQTDCFCGTGVRPDDLDMLPWKCKTVVAASELLKVAALLLPPLRWFSDSVFVHSFKAGKTDGHTSEPSPFPREHNLWILPWLACPVTKGPLEYKPGRNALISHSARLCYPIENDIPILLKDAATSL